MANGWLIRFILARPLATVALGAVGLLAWSSAAVLAYQRGQQLPQAPLPVTLDRVEAHADGNQWVRIDGAPLQCERAVTRVKDVYVPLGRTPGGAHVMAFIGKRTCAKLATEPASGVIEWATEERASRLLGAGSGAQVPRVLIVDMVDTPGFIRIVPWLMAPLILMSAMLIGWGLRERSHRAAAAARHRPSAPGRPVEPASSKEPASLKEPIEQWATCPGCQLRHRRRGDGLCPRCKQPVDSASALGSAVSPSPPSASTEAPSAPVPDSGRLILALSAGGVVLLVVAFVATPRVRDALFPRTVWAINGLDVPLTVTVAGKRMQVPAHGHASVKTAADELEFVARTQGGLEVDRATFRPANRGSNVAFNVLGAATLHARSLVYAREDRHGPVVGDGRANETIEARQVLERTDIDYFLDPAPATIQVDAQKRGVLDRRELVVSGDWRDTVRSLARNRQAAQALKLAQAVAAAEPDEPDPKDAVRALTPRPPGAEEPTETAPHPGESFLAVSADRRARAEQTPTGEGQCTVRCEVSGQVVWTVNECLSKLGEQRFATPDCERLMVVRLFGEASAVWRQSPVVFVYHRGVIERQIPAGHFISQDSGVEPRETYFLWMKGGARLSADGAAVEFETRDGRPQRVPFAPDGRQ